MKRKSLKISLLLFILILPLIFLSGCGTTEIEKHYIYLTADQYNCKVYGAGEYTVNSNVLIYAQGTDEYRFNEWSDGSKENPRTIVVDDNIVLKAKFTQNELNLNKKYAYIESVQLSLDHQNGGWPTLQVGQTISVADWSVIINSINFGSDNISNKTLLKQINNTTVENYTVCGSRNTFNQDSGEIKHKTLLNIDISKNIYFDLTLVVADTAYINTTPIKLSPVIFLENQNKITAYTTYPNLGRIAITFIYHVI